MQDFAGIVPQDQIEFTRDHGAIARGEKGTVIDVAPYVRIQRELNGVVIGILPHEFGRTCRVIDRPILQSSTTAFC